MISALTTGCSTVCPRTGTRPGSARAGTWRALAWAALVWLHAATSACAAGYRIELLSEGAPRRTAQPGESFALTISLVPEGQTQHSAANLRLTFSFGRLVLTSVQWFGPYAGDSENNVSVPEDASLPAVLSEDTLSGPGLPEGVVDVYLSNLLVPPAKFSSGRLARLNLLVPEDYAGPERIAIRAEPESFSDGFDRVSTSAPQSFDLAIVPTAGATNPLLNITPGADALVLTWPAFARNARLESASDLTGESAWQPVPIPPTLDGDRYTILLPRGEWAAARFYRLRFD